PVQIELFFLAGSVRDLAHQLRALAGIDLVDRHARVALLGDRDALVIEYRERAAAHRQRFGILWTTERLDRTDRGAVGLEHVDRVVRLDEQRRADPLDRGRARVGGHALLAVARGAEVL